MPVAGTDPVSIAVGGGQRVLPAQGASKARLLVPAALLVILLFLVAGPLLQFAASSFENAESGSFTLANYTVAFANARRLQALVNSLLIGSAATALCILFAVPIAWAVSRTDMPCKGLIRLTVIATFITPPYLGGIAWILLAAPRAGWLNRPWIALTGGGSGPLNIYSFTGIVFVLAIYAYPYIFIFTSAALDIVSSEMEDAASILGSNRRRTTLRVTLPLVLPAIFGGAIVTFVDAITDFGAPALIGIPAHFTVMTTQLLNFFEYPVQLQVAAAYCAPLLGVTILLLWFQRAVLDRKGYVTLTGKGGERRPIRLGRWRWVALFYALLIGTLSVYLPFLTICQAGFSKAWGRGFSLQNLTLANFHYLFFEYPITRQSITHTLVYAGTAATVCVALAFAISYIVHHRLYPGARLLGALVMAPFVIPGIVLSIAFYAAYAAPPMSLNGTSALVILAFITRFLPIAYINTSAAIRSVNPDMEGAARILGAGRTRTIRQVVAPMLKSSLAGAWLLIFIPAARELSTALFVVGPQTRVLSVLMLDLNEEGNFEILAASGCLLLALILVTVAIGLRLLGRDFMLRQSSGKADGPLRG
jgi:iron(III) transport system permease protein